MKKISLLLVLVFSFLGYSEDFFNWFKENKETCWDLQLQDFNKQFSNSFNWTSNLKKQISTKPAAKQSFHVFGYDITQVLVDYKDGKITSVTFYIFNKGDSKKWNFQRLKKALDTLTKLFTQETGSKAIQNTFQLGSNKVTGLIWHGKQSFDITLKYATGKKKAPEFLTVEIFPLGKAPNRLKNEFQVKKVKSTNTDFTKNVKKESDGSVYINIPMVDQGDKGYCVAAVLSRILSYYGSDIDQHVIAQMAKTDATTGTSFEDTERLLRSAKTKLRFDYKNLYKEDNFISDRSYRKMIRSYNKVASRKKKKKISTSNIPRKNFPALDYSVYKEVRGKARMGSFMRGWVEPYINKGIPICWSVMIFPKDATNGKVKGHMRIINGYNKKTNEIIYTDSWGSGHEKKSMSIEKAWTETLRLFVVTAR